MDSGFRSDREPKKREAPGTSVPLADSPDSEEQPPVSDPRLPSHRYRLSSARRKMSSTGILTPIVILLLLGGIVFLFLVDSKRAPEAVQPEIYPSPTIRALPSPTPAPTPSPEPTQVFIFPEEPTPLPTARPTITPTPSPVPEPRRRRPTPKPGLQSCLRYTASAHQSSAAWGNILVEIEVVNHCGRILEPMEIWFEVSGIREGSIVQSVRGHAFDSLWEGRSETVTIGLPGSLDWYDDVRVELLPP